MGLYVVRVIAELHGGTVTAVNLTSGTGVTIRVTLPRHLAVASDQEYAAG
jgi:signal transduction histidine kinase